MICNIQFTDYVTITIPIEFIFINIYILGEYMYNYYYNKLDQKILLGIPLIIFYFLH